MPYTGTEKRDVRTFFNRHSRNIKQKVQTFAESIHHVPTMDEFITIVNQYVRDPVNGISPLTAGILTVERMQNNRDFLTSFCDNAVSGINVSALSPPPSAAAPLERSDGAILADGSSAAKEKVIASTGLSSSAAASSVNVRGMSVSTLRGDASTGIFYHNTLVSSDSTYGVRGKDGIYRITYVYEKEGENYYLVGFAKHDGTERVRGKRDPVDKYRVEGSLISRLSVGDTLHFR